MGITFKRPECVAVQTGIYVNWYVDRMFIFGASYKNEEYARKGAEVFNSYTPIEKAEFIKKVVDALSSPSTSIGG